MTLRLVVLLALVFAGASPPAAAQAPGTDRDAPAVEPLEMAEVLRSVEARYPPLLAAMIESDLAEGRLAQARSIFDLELFGKAKDVPDGYYEYTTVEAGVEQFLGIWGATVFGSWRRTTGETLPDYYDIRTQEDGALSLGLAVPLLKGGAIDAERAAERTAYIDARAVEPDVARMRLDFQRAAAVAWIKWVVAGGERRIAAEALELARTRETAIREQVSAGLRPDILLVDTRQVVVGRELDLLDAERDFAAAGFALSLFLRDGAGEPIVPGPERLPPDPLLPLPVADAPRPGGPEALRIAMERRPELVSAALDVDRAAVGTRLARNQGLPTLDLTVAVGRSLGTEIYSDRQRSRLDLRLEFKLPVQRSAARGKLAEAVGKEEQARTKLAWSRDKVASEIGKAIAALEAAEARVLLAEEAVGLAATLLAAEVERFGAGASDFLDLQIREQYAIDARAKALKARADVIAARVDFATVLGEAPGGS